MNRTIFLLLLINVNVFSFTQETKNGNLPQESIFSDSSNLFIFTYCIEFELRQSNIKKDSYKCLDSIAEIIKSSDSLVLIVARYFEYDNPKSSRSIGIKRAQSIIEYLVSKGIEKDRLLPQSLMSQSTPNRKHPYWNRTEIQIVAMNYFPRKND
jgi:outer membrane protein OmpA-like peptidoglycan-associated protein